MPGLFEALDNFKNTIEKKHTVTIEGETVEVTLEQKLELLKTGTDVWTIQKNNTGTMLIRKPIVDKEQQQTELVSADPGIKFYEHNPFWPMEHGIGGYKWQIK